MVKLVLITKQQLEEYKPNGLKPGMAWYCPWFYDPENPEPGRREWNYLSKFYWEDWSTKRPPICVVCPGGSHWCIDSKSSNGEGWRVTGEVPFLTTTPSILVPNYHGWLTNGVFSPNV